jgi:16S rRNA (uracil1498-N3)-methyltransferase
LPAVPTRDGPLLALVGPEGGFSNREEGLLHDAGAVPVSLGRTTLRVETAALALAVLAAV